MSDARRCAAISRSAWVSKQGMLQTLQPPFRLDNCHARSDRSQGCCQGTSRALIQVQQVVPCRAQMLLLMGVVEHQGTTLSFKPSVLNGAVQGPDAAGARYALVGVVEHQGTTLSNGHYVAFVQRGLTLPACQAVAAALQQHCPPADPAPAGSNGSRQSTTNADAESGVSSGSESAGAAAEQCTPSSSSQGSGAAAGRGGGTSTGASGGHRRKRSRSPAESSSGSGSSDAAAGRGGAKAGLAGGRTEAPSSGRGGTAAEASQGSASPAGPAGKGANSANPSETASCTAKPDLVEAEMPPDDWETKAVADSPEDDVKPARTSAEASAAPAEEAGPATASPENHTCSSPEAPIPSASEPLCDSESVENARHESDVHAASAALENGQTPPPDAHPHSKPETPPLPERTDGSQISTGLQSGPPAWYCISDTQVKSVSAAEVMACEAYLLLYTRIA